MTTYGEVKRRRLRPTLRLRLALVNGAVLPFVLIFMALLINKRDIMGRYTNSRFFNVVCWGTTVIMIGLTAIMLWQMRG